MGFCMNKFPMFQVRNRQPAIESKRAELSYTKDSAEGRRVMVVVDSSREAKIALLWALSHAVQSQDTLVLLDVIKNPLKNGYEILNAMKKFCEAKKPEIEVEQCLVEGKERGPTIVNETKRQGVSLLVLGQKKRSMTWRLLMMWTRRRASRGVVEHCIQNASCMALAVRRKRRGGGYLITNRQQKDFWLLA